MRNYFQMKINFSRELCTIPFTPMVDLCPYIHIIKGNEVIIATM